MDKKYIILWLCFGFGAFFCLTPIINIFFNIEYIQTITTILLTIGGGLFCSAIVALTVEKNNDKRNKILYDQNEKEYNKKIIEQRNFIFSGLNNEIKQLLIIEIYNFSFFINHKNETLKSKNEYMDIESIINKLLEYCRSINNLLLKDFSKEKIVIDSDWTKFEEIKTNYLISNSINYYKRMLDSISVITSNKNIYFINKIIEEPEFSYLESIGCILEEIVRCSSSNNIDLSIDYKEILYKSLTDFLEIIGINKSKKLNVSYKINQK